MAAALGASPFTALKLSSAPNPTTINNLSSPSLSPHLSLKPSSAISNEPHQKLTTSIKKKPNHLPTSAAASTPATTAEATTFHGLCYVVGDNIDTDQIIPAEYLTLVPSNPDEYQKLGSYALIGLPSSYTTRFIDQGELKTKYSVVIAGDNFGCGSSRDHAPVALGASGVTAVVAESYARIFFRNSVATGEIYPLESEGRLCEECRTGDVVMVEFGGGGGAAAGRLINHTTGKEYGFIDL